jgi:hypothetical protein
MPRAQLKRRKVLPRTRIRIRQAQNAAALAASLLSAIIIESERGRGSDTAEQLAIAVKALRTITASMVACSWARGIANGALRRIGA